MKWCIDLCLEMQNQLLSSHELWTERLLSLKFGLSELLWTERLLSLNFGLSELLSTNEKKTSVSLVSVQI